MGNKVSDEKIDVGKLWQEFDKDRNGVLTSVEFTKMLQALWKRYGIEKPLSKEFVAGLLAELDANQDGKVVKAEFQELFDDLWADRHMLLQTSSGASPSRGQSPDARARSGSPKQSPKSKGRSASPKASKISKAGGKKHSPGRTQFVDKGPRRKAVLECPHCTAPLDPQAMEHLRIPQEQILKLLTPGNYQHRAVLGPYARHPWMPAGTTVQGHWPASFATVPEAQWLPLTHPRTVDF
jgi:hypothetical protein